MRVAEVVAEKMGLFGETGRAAFGDFFAEGENGVAHGDDVDGGAADGGVEGADLGFEFREPECAVGVALAAEGGDGRGVALVVLERTGRAIARGPRSLHENAERGIFF